jgi:hypothetical protein
MTGHATDHVDPDSHIASPNPDHTLYWYHVTQVAHDLQTNLANTGKALCLT